MKSRGATKQVRATPLFDFGESVNIRDRMVIVRGAMTDRRVKLPIRWGKRSSVYSFLSLAFVVHAPNLRASYPASVNPCAECCQHGESGLGGILAFGDLATSYIDAMDSFAPGGSAVACGLCGDDVRLATCDDHVNLPQSTDKQAAGSQKPPSADTDPFAGLAVPPVSNTTSKEPTRSWNEKLFGKNFGFRKEIFSQFDTNLEGQGASRQSLGFEALKKFSSSTATVASLDFQGRVVRRDGWNPVLDDLMGASRLGWAFEYHNLYLDLYNLFNPLLSDKQRSENVGRFNLRAGHFYVPFGLNLQTDTHGTVLQLSNERNFGFDRDWYTGFWGAINKHLNYDAYYLAGSGYDLKFKGQSGLGALRVSLSNKYSSEYGLEGGISIMGGERLAQEFGAASTVVATRRVGIDGRYRRTAPSGLLTFTAELSGGRDNRDAVFMQLYQTEYLRASRRWGLSTQYRRFQQDTAGADAAIIGEVAWYFKNDVSNSNLHSIRLNVQRRLERMTPAPGMKPPPADIITLQYYFYR